MKAYHVFDKYNQDINEQIIFAATRGQAIYVSDAFQMSGDFTSIAGRRASYMDGLDEATDTEKTTRMLENGWYFECKTCGGRTDSDNLATVSGNDVICDSCAS